MISFAEQERRQSRKEKGNCSTKRWTMKIQDNDAWEMQTYNFENIVEPTKIEAKIYLQLSKEDIKCFFCTLVAYC